MATKPIAKAISEVKSSVWFIFLFASLVDSLLVFLLCLLLFRLIHLPWSYSLVPFAIYFVVHTYGNLKDVKLGVVEDKVPSLKEELSTAADNVRDTNPVIEELNEDVLKKMREIHTSYFLSFGRLLREVGIMAVVSFIIIGLASSNVYFMDFKQAISDLKELKNVGTYGVDESQLAFQESQNLSEILGEKTVSELGGNILDLEINPILSDVDIGKVNEPEEHNFQNVVPSQIEAVTDASFEESIPKSYQRIVKTYFKQITKS